MKQIVSLVLAAIFPLALFSWFVPTPYNQLDFILLWLLAMVIVALPTVYAEIALSNRSGLEPMAGIQKLTREADASTVWRGFIWGSMLLAFLLVTALTSRAASALYPVLTGSMGMDIQNFVLPPILLVVAVIASVWGVRVAFSGLVLLLFSLVLNISPEAGLALSMTEINLQEWARAVMLALVSVGAGSGIYWFIDSANKLADSNDKSKLVATKTVLPIWSVQVVAGVAALVLLALGKTGQNSGDMSALVLATKALGLLCLSAVLLHFISQLLKEKLGLIKSLLVTLVIGLALSFLPSSISHVAVIVMTVVSVLLLSVFAGWKMKISHLRKSMNFANELKYNSWRVAIRILVPLAILLAIVGWMQIWLA